MPKPRVRCCLDLCSSWDSCCLRCSRRWERAGSSSRESRRASSSSEEVEAGMFDFGLDLGGGVGVGELELFA